MRYEKYQPYHKVFYDPEHVAFEVIQEQEWEQMTALYTETCKEIFRQVREQCERLDFEGSSIFDETPDPGTIQRISGEIRKAFLEGNPLSEESVLSVQSRSDDFLEDLIRVMLIQEITRRRCRNARCRNNKHNRPPHGRPGKSERI